MCNSWVSPEHEFKRQDFHGMFCHCYTYTALGSASSQISSSELTILAINFLRVPFIRFASPLGIGAYAKTGLHDTAYCFIVYINAVQVENTVLYDRAWSCKRANRLSFHEINKDVVCSIFCSDCDRKPKKMLSCSSHILFSCSNCWKWSSKVYRPYIEYRRERQIKPCLVFLRLVYSYDNDVDFDILVDIFATG